MRSAVHHETFEQGSAEWYRARLGLLTASEMKHIITPTLKAASNDKERQHVFELAAQRISQHVEPHYVSDDMLRGKEDEVEARILYEKHFAQVIDVGFITNNKWGFTLGYSPDGLVGEDGAIECKSRRQKYQVQTIADYLANGIAPEEYTMQIQTALLVSEREWVDFCSYSNGLPMIVVRVYPDAVVQAAILEAASAFEKRVCDCIDRYHAALKDARAIPTERREYHDILV